MTGAEVLDFAREAIWLMLAMSAPIMLVGLAVGVTIALFQALTQVQEMTLVFVPKILAVFLVVVLMGGWMVEQAVAFGTRCFVSIRDIE